MAHSVCCECGKHLEVHHQIFTKNGKTYCHFCYHAYTPTGISSTHIFDKDYSWKKKPSIWWSKIFPFLFVTIILGAVALTLLAPNILVGIFFKNCASDLRSFQCAQIKPQYCDNGKIVDRADLCGCPSWRRQYQNSCIAIVNCTDGTLAPDCSINKPYQCINGSLIEKSSVCGCPTDYAPQNDSCTKIQRCIDGTPYGQCTSNQPVFCDNGALVDRASVCGCPAGAVIESIDNTNGEKCVVSRFSRPPASDSPISSISVLEAETQIHALINAQRAANGLPALNFDERLASIARKHSQDMAARSYFDHNSPEGLNFYDRYVQDGYSCAIGIGNIIYQGAENIFEESGYSLDSVPSTTVDGWMSSSGHRTNILTPYWQNEGIGIAQSSGGAIYITQDFC